MAQKRPRKVRKRPYRTRCPIQDFFAACETEGMRRQQAKRGQRSLRTVMARETGSVARRHAHAPAATGQGRPRERLRSPETAFAAHARPRARSCRKRAQNRPSERLRGTPVRKQQASTHGNGRRDASRAVTAATGARARTCRAAAGDGRRGRVLAPTRPPRLAPDAAPGTRTRHADGTPKRLSEPAPAAVPHADPVVADAGQNGATRRTRGPRDGPSRPHGAM